MYLTTRKHSVFFGSSFRFADFPKLILIHEDSFPRVLELEDEAQNLITSGFKAKGLRKYIPAVCKWGKYAGIGAKVVQSNSIKKIQDSFRAANTWLSSAKPRPEEALRCINQIKNLGRPSFASKHLRMMYPNICPVFDSVLNDKLPYSFNPSGYAEFAKDCAEVARLLNSNGVTNPLRKLWLVADVERAIFAHFYG